MQGYTAERLKESDVHHEVSRVLIKRCSLQRTQNAAVHSEFPRSARTQASLDVARHQG